MQSRIRIASIFLGACAASAAHAEDVVVVTATRTETSLKQVGQSLSVIDEQQIVSRQSDAVVDLLRTVPGLTITRNGGLGTTTSVHIRGAESDQTVSLIDGVKLNDPSAPGGGFNFGNLLTSNVKSIEVLRGSQSTIWGSHAIGGVVNIITRQPTDELKAGMQAEYGSENTSEVSGYFSKQLGRVGTSIGAGYYNTDGISNFNEDRGGTEQDGYRNYSAQAKFDITITDNVSLEVRGWYSNGKVDLDGFPAPTFAFGDTREYSETKETIGYTALKVNALDGRLHNRLAVAYTKTKRDNFDPDGFVTQTFDGDGQNKRFEYQGTFDISDAIHTTFGLESEDSEFDTSSFGGPVTHGETRINSAYAELIAEVAKGFTVIGGLRRDDHDEFGGETTPALSFARSLNDGSTVLRASYAEGFKAPTLYQLQSEYGNALLQPETAKGGDIGITQHFAEGQFEIGATYFRRDSHDLINFVSCTAPFTGICTDRPFGTYDNVARARADGFEAQVTLRPIDAFTFAANYSSIDTENRSPGSINEGKELVRRPGETASALVDYKFNFGLSTGLTYTQAGSSFDNASNTRRVPGYEVVDLRLGWDVNDKVTVQARVENLFDEEYETIYRYGTWGRAAYAVVRVNF